MAGTNTQNTSSAKTNSFPKGMYKDNTDIYISEGLWTNAINAINNSHSGEVGAIGNEPSNKFCTKAPYTIIGFANITVTEWVVFSTNDIDSEIGIFDETKCKYTKVISARCLNFKQTHLITGLVKTNYDCTRSVYWQDDLNPDRVMNLDKVPYICKPKSDNPCDGEVCTDQLDCDAIRLHPLVEQPCLNLMKAKGSGQLNNGSYIAFIAYSENGIRLTDYSMPSVVQSLWQDTGIGGGLEFEVSNLDPEYDEYELVILSVITQQAIAKKIGNYSTSQTKVTIDIIAGSLETVPNKYLPLRSVVYEKSKKMFEVNNYLIRTSVTTQPYVNYQLLANKITAKWVSVEYDSNYYWNGGNKTGYYRDEVYAFFIRWIYNTGNRTASYHIPGRPSKPSDLIAVTGDDVISPTETKAWQVYDTATKQNATGTTDDGGIIKYRGDMAYWESTERYPVEPTVWGTLCNQPIRHHKMPSNETIHIHGKGGNVDTINILGVEFYNIEHPVDDAGNPITDIVGYEILRGSREGNRSIVAKGLFTNMMKFKILGDNTRAGLMQNYPYNDLGDDPFLTNQFSVLDLTGSEFGNDKSSSAQGAQGGDAKGTDDAAGESGSVQFSGTGEEVPSYKTENTPKILSQDILKNIFAFHSVEGSFIRPALGGNYVKIYTEEIGTSLGRFLLPYKHPRFQFLTDGALWLAIPISLGLVIVDALGKTTITGGNQIEAGVVVASASVSASASKETGSGTWISDLVGSNILAAVSSGGQSINAGLIEGLINITLGASYYFPKALNALFTIIKNFNNQRDYVLQFNSHGYFNNFNTVTNTSIPSAYQKCFRRAVVPNKAKYIGMHVQDFDNTYRVNNVHRSKYICLEVSKDIPNPVNIDNSKKSLQDIYKSGNDTIHQNPFISVTSNIVQYYGAIKVDFQNQYGQLDNIVQIPVNSCIYKTKPLIGFTNNTKPIFGGDIYINRYTEKNPYLFFNTWLMGEPDGSLFDYRAVVNGPVPRYFAAFYNFEAQDFKVKFERPPGKIIPRLKADTPSDFYRFDQGSAWKSGKLVKKNAWFYLSYNGVRDFYTESELNMAFRDYGEDVTQKFYDVYGNSFNDTNIMFRSDYITKPTFYKYDLSLSVSKLFTNLSSWGKILPRDYTPMLYSSCFEYYPKRVVYSLQQQDGLRRDNWRNYLPLNFKDFGGVVSSIKSINASGSVLLFENESPIYFTGVDELKTEAGTKVTIGDGGLFANNYKTLTNAQDALGYGHSISSRATINTPYGLFFVSQKSGKIFQSNGSSMDEISKLGMKFWFAKHLPSKFLEMYPDYPLYDNPVKGIGVQAIYDSTYELIYFTKRDLVPLKTNLHFDDPSGVPYYYCDEEAEDTTYSEFNSEEKTPAASMPPAPSAFMVTPSVTTPETPPSTTTVTTGTNEGCVAPIDVAFVLDITGSMSGPLNNLKASITTIATEAALKSNDDYRFALVTVNESYDEEQDKVVLLNQNVVSFANNNIDDFKAKLNLVTIGDGNGTPEPTDVGIDSVLKGELGVFRSNAIKMIIMITDAVPSGLDDNETAADLTEVTRIATLAKSKGVKIYPIATGVAATYQSVIDAVKVYHDVYANTTGGKTNSSASGVIGNIISDEIKQIACPVTCNLGASVLEVKQGSKVTLNWTTTDAVSASIIASKGLDVGSVPVNGQIDVYPTSDVTFTLKAQGANSETECKVTIKILPPPDKCPCAFDDPRCFKECGWTVSYDPKAKVWMSFHSWMPTLMIPARNHFYTINNNSLWKHNERWDSYCNFYGVNYPWEIEIPVSTPNQITTLRNIEFYMDVYKYYNDGNDFHHVLDEGFDRAIIFNSEQISGLLKLKVKDKNNPLDLVQVPTVDPVGINILYSKEENKFRFNQFWDITDDRGEFSGVKLPMWLTDCNGYSKTINPEYVDYAKPMTEHKKFRHYANKIILRKNISKDNKMILKISNTKNLNSPR